ncbi:Uncharacterised protein [Nocardia asteroides]|nr:hypothetical protein SAMN05444423_112130 [Nocardia asteroides]VEG32701.1 Uncharacterised protein [Nocardia asteroides]
MNHHIRNARSTTDTGARYQRRRHLLPVVETLAPAADTRLPRPTPGCRRHPVAADTRLPPTPGCRRHPVAAADTRPQPTPGSRSRHTWLPPQTPGSCRRHLAPAADTPGSCRRHLAPAADTGARCQHRRHRSRRRRRRTTCWSASATGDDLLGERFRPASVLMLVTGLANRQRRSTGSTMPGCAPASAIRRRISSVSSRRRRTRGGRDRGCRSPRTDAVRLRGHARSSCEGGVQWTWG